MLPRHAELWNKNTGRRGLLLPIYIYGSFIIQALSELNVRPRFHAQKFREQYFGIGKISGEHLVQSPYIDQKFVCLFTAKLIIRNGFIYYLITNQHTRTVTSSCQFIVNLKDLPKSKEGEAYPFKESCGWHKKGLSMSRNVIGAIQEKGAYVTNGCISSHMSEQRKHPIKNL